jgi:hypothetical protein
MSTSPRGKWSVYATAHEAYAKTISPAPIERPNLARVSFVPSPCPTPGKYIRQRNEDNEAPMGTRHVHIRAPGVKTGSTIGTLGPFRGTLGIQWVIGAIAVSLVLVLAGSWFLFREPPPPFERVEAFTIEQIGVGTAREAFAGIYLGRTSEESLFAVAEPVNCPLEVGPEGYVDCADRRYGLDGVGHSASLLRLPVEVHRGSIYIDLSQVSTAA